jgi:anti-anti-sigma factor
MDDVAFRARTNGAVVVLSGELDLAGVAQLESAIERARAAGSIVTIDLTNLDFIDSSGLRVLVGLHNAATRDEFEYTLIAGPPAVHRAFVLSGLDQTLTFALPGGAAAPQPGADGQAPQP